MTGGTVVTRKDSDWPRLTHLARAAPRSVFDIEFDLDPLQAMIQLEKRAGDDYQPVVARLQRSGSSLSDEPKRTLLG